MFKYYLIAAIAFSVGGYLIYSGLISYDKMTKLNGKIVNKEEAKNISHSRGSRGDITYTLAITINTCKYDIGIPLAERDYLYTLYNENLDIKYVDSMSNLFDTNTVYTFYLNPLVPA
jgi:hypothetical protein